MLTSSNLRDKEVFIKLHEKLTYIHIVLLSLAYVAFSTFTKLSHSGMLHGMGILCGFAPHSKHTSALSVQARHHSSPSSSVLSLDLDLQQTHLQDKEILVLLKYTTPRTRLVTTTLMTAKCLVVNELQGLYIL